MDRTQIEESFNDVFDEALIFHGFTDYMRDYELILFVVAPPSTGIASEHPADAPCPRARRSHGVPEAAMGRCHRCRPRQGGRPPKVSASPLNSRDPASGRGACVRSPAATPERHRRA